MTPFNSSSTRSRRHFLRSASCGFGALSLNALLQERAAAANDSSPLSLKRSHFQPRAKRIIFLFMKGGPSQMDLFDYKPRLARGTGKVLPYELPKTEATVGMETPAFSDRFQNSHVTANPDSS